jgi:hypothetical protein
MEKVKVTSKVCRRCGKELDIEMFRPRVSGFILNQCKACEKELSTARRMAKKLTAAGIVTITTKSGKVVEASTQPIVGGRKASSPSTDKVLYFKSDTNRDAARAAFGVFADVPRTGILYQSVES